MPLPYYDYSFKVHSILFYFLLSAIHGIGHQVFTLLSSADEYIIFKIF